jgi:hypothetical protein
MQNAIRPLISEARGQTAENPKIKPPGELAAASPVRNMIDAMFDSVQTSFV